MRAIEDERLGLGARITTFASNIIGSWWMIALQTVSIGLWFGLNIVSNPWVSRWDNDKFDLLRLALNLQSVYTAPLILMAQRRIGAKDRKVLYEIADDERQASLLRAEAQGRRIRLEEKVDRLTAMLEGVGHRTAVVPLKDGILVADLPAS